MDAVVLQQGDSEHAVEGTDADLLIGPVIHRPPSLPITLLESAKDQLDMPLTGVGGDQLFCRPIEAVGLQHGSPQSLRHQSFQSPVVEAELQTITSRRIVSRWIGSASDGRMIHPPPAPVYRRPASVSTWMPPGFRNNASG
jgi:hypothetical protein